MRVTDSKKIAADRRKAGIVAPVAPAKKLDGVPRPRAKVLPMHVIECDAWELPQFASDPTLTPDKNRTRSNEIHPSGGAWQGGCSSWEQVQELLTKGWPDGAAQARKLADGLLPLLPPPESLRRKTRWAEDGGELDRDRLYSGGIETAFRTTRQHLQRGPRTVKIVGSWSINAGWGADAIAWNGSAITALVDLLENADFRVELSLCLAAQQPQPQSISMPIVRIKTASEPMNVDTIAAVAGHAAIFRTYGFKMICTSPHTVAESLGRALTITDAWGKAVEAGVLEPVDAFMELATSEAGALARVGEVLKKLMPHDPDFLANVDAMIAGRPAEW